MTILEYWQDILAAYKAKQAGTATKAQLDIARFGLCYAAFKNFPITDQQQYIMRLQINNELYKQILKDKFEGVFLNNDGYYKDLQVRIDCIKNIIRTMEPPPRNAPKLSSGQSANGEKDENT